MASNDDTHVSLREVFTPLFARVLFFARSPDIGQQTFAEVRKEISALLEDQKLLIKRHQISQADYESARFAVVAWVDEMMLKASFETNQQLYQQWTRSPFQAELYNTTNAGEEFFERLAQLRPDQKEICEIYHLCLCLGFRGQYYSEEQDRELLELRRDCAQRLPVTFPDLVEIERQKERVTPQPYEVTPPPQKSPPRAPSRWWAGVAATALAGLLVYFFWPASQCGNQQLDPGEQCDLSATITQCADGQTCLADCTCPPPLPEPALATIEDAVKGFECSEITVADVRNGVVQLNGRVQSEEQRQQVRNAVLRVQYVRDVRDAFQLIPRPFCEVIALLDPLKRKAQAVGNSIEIRPDRQCGGTYYLEEKLVAEVSAEKPLQHVYVDYYVADRQHVAHILPHPEQPANFFATDTVFRIGETTSKKQWTILEPLGLELLTVIRSPQPLFATQRLVGAESVGTYLPELDAALSQNSATGDIAATYCFITTKEKK
ncbi:MAG: DotU/TssL family secretion system protein [Candidatus Binatia bacterium]